MRREEGQVLPVLLVFMVAVLAVGFMLFQGGRASALRSQGQTAADAAALAGAKNVGVQLSESARESPDLVNNLLVRQAAEDYAERNGAEVIAFERRELDVLVTVRTKENLGREGERADSKDKPAVAKARARIDPLFGTLAGAGGIPTGNIRGELADAVRLGQSFGLVVTSHLRPGDSDSLHSQGIAVDMAGGPIGSTTGPMAQFYRAALKRYKFIEELFYDPLGGIDKNVQIGPIGGHSNHVHIALTGGGPGKDAGSEPLPKGGGGGAGAGASVGGLYSAKLVQYED